MSLDLNKSYGSDRGDDAFSGNVSLRASDNSDSGGDADSERQCSSRENCGPESEMEDGVNSVEALKKIVEKRLDLGSVVDTLDEVCIIVHEGPPDNKSSVERLPAFKKQTYRSNCKARLRVARDYLKSPWKVYVFVKQHNHELLHPRESYLLRSAHNMSQPKETLLIAMQASGIRVSRAYNFVENEAGSRENIGFIRKDVYNELHCETRNLSKVDNANANRLLEYLTERGMSDPSLYWKVKLNDDGRFKNLLFRDSRCLIDYQHFGDVVSVDATYKTNKYELICAPLVGINHHRTNVVFAIAFLSNENCWH